MNDVSAPSVKGLIDSTINVLEVRELSVHFAGRGRWRHRREVKAVDGVSFDIAQGEILALVGESGCGKSTIALSVMRLLVPTSGRIISGGEDLATLRGRALRRARRRIQMIFQDPFGSLNQRQSVYDTVVEPLIIHQLGATSQERRSMVMDALDLAHLRPPERLAEAYPHELSGGQRQRVAIASAMVMRPELVIADEPVSMLDVSARAGILRLMMDLRDRLGTSYLFITHDLAVAWMVADRIAVVYLGRIVEIGPATQIVDEPAHPYTRALLSVSSGEDIGADGAVTDVLPGETPSAANVPPGCRFHPRCPLFVQLGEPAICRSEDPALRIVLARRSSAYDRPPGVHQSACHFANEESS
ncbi:MAG: ABC transporter ATP-binding protein [Acidimicrobiaceae bacterium]|nr:ABC transporter ATP-binding protein [Acidimicrobiaceae bacterium]